MKRYQEISYVGYLISNNYMWFLLSPEGTQTKWEKSVGAVRFLVVPVGVVDFNRKEGNSYSYPRYIVVKGEWRIEYTAPQNTIRCLVHNYDAVFRDTCMPVEYPEFEEDVVYDPGKGGFVETHHE